MENLRNNLSDFVSPAVLWVVFLLTILVFIVVSVALMYHWRNYNTNSSVGKRVRRAYFLVSGGFLFAMLAALIAYST